MRINYNRPNVQGNDVKLNPVFPVPAAVENVEA
jgi:hypothetical protein